jgi:hypothetical protein
MLDDESAHHKNINTGALLHDKIGFFQSKCRQGSTTMTFFRLALWSCLRGWFKVKNILKFIKNKLFEPLAKINRRKSFKFKQQMN